MTAAQAHHHAINIKQSNYLRVSVSQSVVNQANRPFLLINLIFASVKTMRRLKLELLLAVLLVVFFSLFSCFVVLGWVL